MEPINFPLCWNCGHDKTATQLACQEEKDKGVIEKDAFVSMRKTGVPLIGKIPPKLTVNVLIAHWDVCLKCGVERCTRVEVITQPVQVQMGNAPPGFPGGQFPGTKNDPRFG